jgi:hypothetical protein
MPEDFSNKLVVDRIHTLTNMFSKDEILNFPSVNPSDKAGLVPIWIGEQNSINNNAHTPRFKLNPPTFL